MKTKQLFVSPEGDDRHAGTAARPLATPAAALAKAECEAGDRDVEIHLGPGRYLVSQTLRIPRRDARLALIGDAAGGTVLDGGLRLTGLAYTTVNRRRAVVGRLPGRIKGTVDQLWVNGERATRAALPKDGDFFRLAPSLVPLKNELFAGGDRFRVREGDFDPAWEHLEDVEILITQKWVEAWLRFERFEPATREVVCREASRFELDPAGTEYRVVNLKAALTRPGEYYYCKKENLVYYLPRRGETIENLELVVPAINLFLVAAGTRQSPIRNLELRHLNFEYAGRDRAAVGLKHDCGVPGLPRIPNYLMRPSFLDGLGGKRPGGSPQAAVHLPGLLFFDYVTDSAVLDCRIRHGNYYGIRLERGCRNFVIAGNEIADLGGGGIAMTGAPADRASRSSDANSGHRIVNNHLHHLGCHNLSAVGILGGHSFGNLIEHNHLHDIYYTGISLGWVWGYAESMTRENRVGYNLIHDLGKKVLSDMGGIYLLGVQAGTRIYHNLIYRVDSRYYGGWGIYTDEGSSHIVIEKNVCYDCNCDAFHQHYGRENIFRYNLGAFSGQGGIAISNFRNEGFSFPGENYAFNVNFYGNVIVNADRPFFKRGLAGAVAPGKLFSDLNLFWHYTPGVKCFAYSPADVNDRAAPPVWSVTFAEWQKLGFDTASRLADPGFVNPAKRDFRLKKNSPLHRPPFYDFAETLAKAGLLR